MRTRHVARELAHLSDEAVVALMARSHDVALAELYDRFGRVAWGLALRVLRDEALAEDAVQEAFLTAWRTASRFVPERGSARNWLLTLVHRRAGPGERAMADETIHELTAAYALDALDEGERDAYEEHLATCERCRDELGTLSEATAALAYGVETPLPPPSLRGRILEEAAAER